MSPFPYMHYGAISHIFHVFCSLSSARIPIEISFGILVSRWRLLLGMLLLKLETSINIVKCVICLHNFLMTKELNEDDEEKLYANARFVNKIHQQFGIEENEVQDEEEGEGIANEVALTKDKVREALATYFQNQ